MGGRSWARRIGAIVVVGSVSTAGLVTGGNVAVAAPPVITDPPTRVYTAVEVPIVFNGMADPITGDTRAIDIASAEGNHATCNPGSNHNDGQYTGACVSVQLQVDHGTLSLSSGAVEFHVGDGTNDTQINISGTLPDINAALKTLTYTPADDYETTDGSPAELDVSVQDAKTVTETTNLTVDIRVEGDNAWPDLAAPTDDPYDVNVNQVFTILDSTGTEEYTVTDEDIDQGEVDDYMLGVAWVDCGEINFPVDGGVLGEPAALLADAGFDPALLPGMVPNGLGYSTSGSDAAQAVAWLAGIDTFNDVMRWIEFHAPATAGTCTMTMVVTDLGNNGMPLAEEIPSPGIDFDDSVQFNVIDDTTSTTTSSSTSIPDDSTTTSSSSIPGDSTTTSSSSTSVPGGSTTTSSSSTSVPGGSTTTSSSSTSVPDDSTTSSSSSSSTSAPDDSTTTTSSEPAGSTSTSTSLSSSSSSSTASPETTGAAPVTPPPAAGLAAAVVVPRLQRGQTQTGTGQGFQPGEVVTAEQHSSPLALGTQVADASGNVTFTWSIRAGEALGVHAFIVTGPQSGTASANFEVFAPAGGGGGGAALPRTGSSVAVLITLAGLLLLAGTVLVRRSRRA